VFDEYVKPRLLVLDDDEDTQQLLQYRFSAAGFNVDVASSGMEALDKARRFLPELIIVDVVLPDFDGFVVCDILHAQPSTADTPIILLSCHSGLEVEMRASQCGVGHCFKKSIDLNEIIECARQMIDKHRESCAARLMDPPRYIEWNNT
jgi:DNA-binding response OmpR family regulator